MASSPTMGVTPAARAIASMDLELLEFSAKSATAPDSLTAATALAMWAAVASCCSLKSDRAAPMKRIP